VAETHPPEKELQGSRQGSINYSSEFRSRNYGATRSNHVLSLHFL
jgi:hypothetical protein